jgi:hypothetical protein
VEVIPYLLFLYELVFGYMKIEPAFTKYREQHNYKKVEAYVLYNDDSIVYVQPIVQ